MVLHLFRVLARKEKARKLALHSAIVHGTCRHFGYFVFNFFRFVYANFDTEETFPLWSYSISGDR